MGRLTCRICGSNAEHTVYTAVEMMFGFRDPFSYFQCSRCGCFQISDIPSDMSKFYPPDYYSFSPKKRKYLENPVVSRLRRFQDHYTVFNRGFFGTLVGSFFPNKKLSALAHIGNLTTRSRIMDVGCGDGWRLSILRDIGFEYVSGIDPYIRESITCRNGVSVQKKFIHDISGEWDVIMYHHSFEHVPDQLETLRRVASLLSRDGCCLLRIPTVSSFAWGHYREYWFQLDAPRHFYLHSLESMNILVEKAGLTVRDVIFDSTVDQFQGSELYLRGIPYVSGEGVFTRTQLRAWKRRAQQLNDQKMGDQAVFYVARK